MIIVGDTKGRVEAGPLLIFLCVGPNKNVWRHGFLIVSLVNAVIAAALESDICAQTATAAPTSGGVVVCAWEMIRHAAGIDIVAVCAVVTTAAAAIIIAIAADHDCAAKDEVVIVKASTVVIAAPQWSPISRGGTRSVRLSIAHLQILQKRGRPKIALIGSARMDGSVLVNGLCGVAAVVVVAIVLVIVAVVAVLAVFVRVGQRIIASIHINISVVIHKSVLITTVVVIIIVIIIIAVNPWTIFLVARTRVARLRMTGSTTRWFVVEGAAAKVCCTRMVGRVHAIRCREEQLHADSAIEPDTLEERPVMAIGSVDAPLRLSGQQNAHKGKVAGTARLYEESRSVGAAIGIEHARHHRRVAIDEARCQRRPE
jgi:hypothetical protein